MVFTRLRKQAPHPRPRVRLLGMAHLQEGREYHEIVTALRVRNKVTVQGWAQRFKAAGLDGLRESPRSGAKRKLEPSQEAQFKASALGLQEQRSGGRVAGHDVRALLEGQFQVACCPNSVYNRLDLAWITVRSKRPKQSQASQDAFKKTSATR